MKYSTISFINIYICFIYIEPAGCALNVPINIEILCAIWFHLYNLKNVKNIHRGTLSPLVFSCFLDCTNGTKLRNTTTMTEPENTSSKLYRNNKHKSIELQLSVFLNNAAMVTYIIFEMQYWYGSKKFIISPKENARYECPSMNPTLIS